MESLKEKIARVIAEKVEVVAYDPLWPELYRKEKAHLLSCLPPELIVRVEHFGSTAVPGLRAKPIVDILVEVACLQRTRELVAPILEGQNYDYFWRPTWGDDVPPYYAMFIKRDHKGSRTHHIHMIERDFPHWERLLFRDYLIEHPKVAKEYGGVKERLSRLHSEDRLKYASGKKRCIERITRMAKNYYEGIDKGS